MANESRSNKSSQYRPQNLSEKHRSGEYRIGDKTQKGHVASSQPPLRPTNPKK